uniref:Uncharacterized protein n=1 Tax=Setaria italica TaxID=4555 RepID=K3ZG18_SETIT
MIRLRQVVSKHAILCKWHAMYLCHIISRLENIKTPMTTALTQLRADILD